MKRCATARSRASVSVHVLEQRMLLSAAFDQTGLTDVRLDPNFAGIDGSDVGVAVLDTGIYAQHPALRDNVIAYYNAVTQPLPTFVDPASLQLARDLEGHGTHVAGTIAAANGEIGVAPDAKIISVHVLADPAEPQIGGDPLLRGLQYVQRFADQLNIKVVNMSLGAYNASGGLNLNSVPDPDEISSAIDALEAMGITVVTSSGNSYANDPEPGAGYPAVVSTLSVANTWATTGVGHDFSGIFSGAPTDQYATSESSALPDRLNSTSQRSTLGNQVAAPGTDIFSTWNGQPGLNGPQLFNTISGTSMASPFVAGVVALMQEAALQFGGRYFQDVTQIRDIIQETADPIVDTNVTDNARYRIVNGGLDPTPLPLPETGETFLRVNAGNALRRVRSLFLGTPGGDLDSTASTATTLPPMSGGSSVVRRGDIGADGAVVIGPNDIDLFKVNLTAPGDLSVLLAPPSGGQVFNPSIRLFNSAGAEIARADGANGIYPSFRTSTTTPLVPGVYYVGVSSLANVTYSIANGSNVGGGNSEGDYALTISVNNPDFDGVAQGAHAIDLTTPDTLAFATRVSNARSGIIGADDPVPGTPDTGRALVPGGDVDMYRLIAPDNGKINARTLSSRIPGQPTVDTYLRFFDSNFVELAANDDQAPGNLDSLLDVDVTMGSTYYVGVTNFANRTFSPLDPYGRVGNSTTELEPYSLYVAFSSGDTDGTAVSAARRDVGAPVVDAVGTDASVVVGASSGFKDVDFSWFQAPNDGLLDLSVTPSTPGFQSVLALWEYDGSQHTVVKLGEAAGDAPRLVRQVVKDHILYASVTGSGNQTFNWFAPASGPGGQVGGYTLNSALQPLAQLATFSDGAVQGGTPGTVTAGVPTLGNLGMDNSLLLDADVDVYRFVPASTGRFDVRTDTSAEGSADTVLRVFDAAGNPVALNDNARSSTNASALRVSLVAGQTYYVGVSGAGAGAGTYDVNTGAGAGAGSRGAYTLSVNPTPAGAPAVSVDDAPAVAESFRGGSSATFTVRLSNPSASPVTVAWVTSDATAAAGSDFTGGSGTVTFAPGETAKTFTVPVTGDTLGEGDETFSVDVTVVDSADAVVADEHAVGTIQNQLVQPLGFNAGLPATFTDANGSRVRVTMRGPGSGQVLMLGDTPSDPAAITLTGTTGATSVNIAGDTSVGDVTVTGSLKSLLGKTTDLMGNLSVSGFLTQLRMRSLTGHTISIGPGGMFSANLGAVTDSSLGVQGPIRSLKVGTWADGDATADGITATTINSITSLGDFGADVTAATLGKLNVRGALTGSDVRVAGNIGSVRAGSATNSRVFAGVRSDVTTLPAAAVDFASSAAIGSFRAGAFSNTLVAATSVGKVLLGAITTANGGTAFGVAADTLRALTTPTLRLKNLSDPAATQHDGDFFVRVV